MIDIDVVGQLFPNVVTVIVQLLSTLVLFLVAKKFLYKPVMNMLEQRADASYNDLASAKLANEKAQLSVNEANKYLNDSKAKANSIIENATNDANKVKQDIINKANITASNTISNANKTIEAKKASLLDSVSDDMVDIALAASEKLLQQKANSETDSKAVDQFVKDIVSHG